MLSEINSRERLTRAIEFGTPDRIPVMHWTLPGAYRVYGSGLAALYERYPSDVLLSPVFHKPFGLHGIANRPSPAPGEIIRDHWGCVWKHLSSDYEGLPISFPLVDYKLLDDYSFPDPLLGREGADHMVDVVRADGHQHYVIAYVGNLWQQLHKIRGFENCLIDLMEQREEFLYLINRMEKYLLKRIEYWCEFEEVDGLHIGDDWGTQTQLMVRPSIWRQVFKPVYRRLVEAIHAGGKHAHFHSDGHTRAIVPDLVEIGFDTLNLQVWCMDVDELGREFAGKVCFRGEMDRQDILPNGTPEAVRGHVRRACEIFSRTEGGYIHYGQVGPDVPWANVEAMLRAFYGS
jgi:uroporphyrinogen-III decarboxylase